MDWMMAASSWQKIIQELLVIQQFSLVNLPHDVFDYQIGLQLDY